MLPPIALFLLAALVADIAYLVIAFAPWHPGLLVLIGVALFFALADELSPGGERRRRLRSARRRAIARRGYVR